MNKKNLLKLATYLLSGNLKAEFNMSTMFMSECGTICCAAGHGPYAGINRPTNEDWSEYIDRRLTSNTYEITWLFCADWRKTDNTPEGAGKRILYLIRYGLPCDWHQQMRGRNPLCYLNETL